MTSDPYVHRWFVPFDAFCDRIGAVPAIVAQLIAAGAMPGAIYAPKASDPVQWWSALDKREPPLSPADEWFAPAAIWWGRRALLHFRTSNSFEASAEANRQHFVAGFVEALRNEPLAAGAFPAAFDQSGLNHTAARQCAGAEWQDWIKGGYAICLQRFSAESCVRKEALARRLRRHFDAEAGYELAPQDLFDMVERLEAVLLPFAPWQRAACTPGRVIDPALTALDLGPEQPYW